MSVIKKTTERVCESDGVGRREHVSAKVYILLLFVDM